VGSIEIGKRADLTLVERDRVHLAPAADPWSTLVYAARGTDVRMTMVDGEILVNDFTLARLDGDDVVAEATDAARKLAQKAGLNFAPGDSHG
jgi:5-methylthioadenosine/S-adenosylhomocysteine deaminase